MEASAQANRIIRTQRPVLLIEPEDRLRDLFAFALRNAGFTTLASATLSHALGLLEDTHWDFVVLDLRQPEMERVGRISAKLSRLLGQQAGSVTDMRIAAALHDIGEVAVPNQILCKLGRLLPEEFETVKRHVAVGARILSAPNLPVFRLAREIALHHHERWDGCGYPRGLRREKIPLAARIVAVADTWEALTHPRPYRAAYHPEAARSILQGQRGRQFDPHIVDSFFQLLPGLPETIPSRKEYRSTRSDARRRILLYQRRS